MLLSIIRHTTENNPSLYSGALFGFEREDGSLIISHGYPYPYPDQYEGGSLRSRSGAKYQQEMLDLLRNMGCGVEFQGWFQSSLSGNFVTSQLVESLAQQQLVNGNSFILVHNMASFGKEIDLTALRLSENFINTYIDGKWRSKSLEHNKLSYLNIFEEVPISVHNQRLIDLYLAAMENKRSPLEFDVLNLSSNQATMSHLLESMYSQVDSYNYDQTNYNYYQRIRQKEQSKISQWKQQRKLENLERNKLGEKELDLDEYQSIFKLPSEPSRYHNMLYSHSIDVLADGVLSKCEEDLTKSFAIQRQLTSND